jgi:hypothetical protein
MGHQLMTAQIPDQDLDLPFMTEKRQQDEMMPPWPEKR